MILRDLLIAEPILARFHSAKPKLASAGYRIGLVLRALQPYLDEFRKQRDALLQEYGTPVEGQRGSYHFRISNEPDAEVDQERFDKFRAAIEELSATEIDYNGPWFTPELLDLSGVEFESNAEINIFAWLVKERDNDK